MTIQNALTFIKLGQQDEGLRHRLVQAPGKAELKRVMTEERLCFSQDEFEEAYSLSLFKCQNTTDAESLMTFRMWWNLLVRSTEQ